MSALEQQARAALASIYRVPAVFTISRERQARWSAGVAHLAQAIQAFAELAVGDEDRLELAGEIGESLVLSEAEEAAHELREILSRFAEPDWEQIFRGIGEDMANGATSGEQGQRRLLAIAAAIEERFPPLPPLGERS